MIVRTVLERGIFFPIIARNVKKINTAKLFNLRIIKNRSTADHRAGSNITANSEHTYIRTYVCSIRGHERNYEQNERN